ncbi:MAG: hypothetical protein LBQ05_01925, partial [Christensenellaceae bacterium]|nr:hypothetical protein [Christensenellaceae bacterium]
MNEVIDLLNQWGGLALLGLLVLFVLISGLFGLVRGFKRSWIRLASVVGIMTLAFLLTPVISQAVYTSKLLPQMIPQLDGMTLEELLDEQIEDGLAENAETVNRVRTIMPDFEIIAEGIGFAVINIILFFVLYFVAKFISWILYVIFAKIYAPKYEKSPRGVKLKKKNREKIPQHRGFGFLVGMVQGFVLFFFLFLPINGSLSILHSIAAYQAFDGEVTLQTGEVQTANANGVSPASANGVQTANANGVSPASANTSANEVQTAAADGDAPTSIAPVAERPAAEVFDDIVKIDGAFYGAIGNKDASAFAKIYTGVIKYTGLAGLSRKAFDYQMTVQLE